VRFSPKACHDGGADTRIVSLTRLALRPTLGLAIGLASSAPCWHGTIGLRVRPGGGRRLATKPVAHACAPGRSALPATSFRLFSMFVSTWARATLGFFGMTAFAVARRPKLRSRSAPPPASVPRCRRIVLVVALGIASVAAVARADARVEADARALEERLHAPCCRGQMLDAHESEVTRELRRDIRARLRAGESAAALERALVQQYGASIVAVPKDRDPRGGLSLALIAALAVSALALVVQGARWVRRTRDATQLEPASRAASQDGDELDARLERELRRLDT
jgi:cytochrome c-type biogenesis protein CcmH